MKTTSLHLFRSVCLTAVLGLIISAGNAQPSPEAVGQPVKGEQPISVATLPEIPGALDLFVIDSNNHGQIIGAYFDEDFNVFGFVYANGIYTMLDFEPQRINDRGQIVGNTFDESTFLIHSFLYDQGTYTSIDFPGALEGGGFITGLNDRGQVLGIYSDGRNDHGFIYDKGIYTALPDVPGARLTYPQSINNLGQIVGWSYDSNLKSHSFFYENGVYTGIDVPGAARGTYLSDINDKGQIVGISYDSAFNAHSFVYEKGDFTSIEIPDALVTSAYGINDRNQIIGTYYDADFLPHGYVLSR